MDGRTRLVHSADGLPTLPRLGVLHLAVPIQAVEELPSRRLRAQLEWAPEVRDADVALPPSRSRRPAMLGVAVLPTARSLV